MSSSRVTPSPESGRIWMAQVAQVIMIDAAGTILIPGLVDTHRHMWQG